jgi:hypothetical protein
MKLGEMLLRDGHVGPDQVQAALARQARDGARFGTVMVEMGFVDLDTITVYLGLELGLPIATGATLDRAKRTAVRLLTPQQAARYRCVPLIISDRQLIAAMDDPYDMVALDELARLTGYRIIPRVAAEIRIHYYIERYFGVPRPPRRRVLGDTPRGQRQAPSSSGTLPGPSLPGLPPIAAAPVAAPTPRPVLRPVTAPGAADGAVAAADALAIDAADLVIEMEADEADTAETAPPTRRVAPSPAPPTGARLTDYPALDRERAGAAMAVANQRGEVADATLSWVRGVLEAAALLVVRNNLAFGWKGFGFGIARDRLEALLIPLDAQSMFRAALEVEEVPSVGPVFPADIHTYLYKVLRCSPPFEAVVLPIVIGRRVVNLLYGHAPGGSTLDGAQRAELAACARTAARAYARLIAVAKRETQRIAQFEQEDTEP